MSVRRPVLWDSSAILACIDADDADHDRALAVAGGIAAEKRPSFITNYIEAEAHALLLRKLGRALAREWLLTRGLPVIRVLPEEEERGREIIMRRSDKNWSLCDAISVALLERRGIRCAFSFDHIFLQYGRIEVLGLQD